MHRAFLVDEHEVVRVAAEVRGDAECGGHAAGDVEAAVMRVEVVAVVHEHAARNGQRHVRFERVRFRRDGDAVRRAVFEPDVVANGAQREVGLECVKGIEDHQSLPRLDFARRDGEDRCAVPLHAALRDHRAVRVEHRRFDLVDDELRLRVVVDDEIEVQRLTALRRFDERCFRQCGKRCGENERGDESHADATTS